MGVCVKINNIVYTTTLHYVRYLENFLEGYFLPKGTDMTSSKKNAVEVKV